VPRHPDGVRNRVGWPERLARLRGTSIEYDLRSYEEPLAEAGHLGRELATLTDDALRERVRNTRARGGADGLHAVRTKIVALIREIAARTIGLRPFDEQIVAAFALDRGAIVEMQTGEGKTLAAVMPVGLAAMAGKGAHVLTFNDYLARRDAEWMRPIYEWLGLSVAFVQQGMPPAERQRAYAADVTYVTAKEAGFDHLRDHLARRTSDLVHRPFHFALVDEADSLLIDEARVPLVIAGSVERSSSSAARLAELVGGFTAGVHYDMDEYGRDAELTDAGIDRIERALGCGSLHDSRNYTLLTEINCALHARALLRRDVDYIVKDGRIGVIDELTGRVVADRHWPDGLQAALEAKESLDRRSDGRILGSITLQDFLRSYPRLCGMTGTAQPAATELSVTYGLPVVVIPTHRPVIRIDRPDVVFGTREEKDAAIVSEVARVRATGRPILVGTLSVEESERLSARLQAGGIECEILNAKNDAAEAGIVARAGAIGAVTISTNMAGRGTDIKLGGADEAEHDAVAALGGLYVIGTNRHESLRIDQQLKGRAGRQGDPGESRFFVSLEDDLLVKYGIQGLIAGRFVAGDHRGPIEHPVVLREIARAQRIVEGQNLEIRKTLCRYASVVEHQRQLVMAWRQSVLDGSAGPQTWHGSPSRQALVDAAGEDAVVEAERAVTLHHIDRVWADHLALVADVREGVHLVALGGKDPLRHFTAEIAMAFHSLAEHVEASVVETLNGIEVKDGRVELAPDLLKGPSSTWTYLVNDDPFRNQIGMMLTGPGRVTLAINAAALTMPLLVLWGVVDRVFRRRRKR
jgi:preprotein translocase subunit SecA